MPQKLVLFHGGAERINGVLFTRCKNIVGGDALARRGVETLWAHGSQVDNNGNAVRSWVTGRSAGTEGVWRGRRLEKSSGQVVVLGIRLQPGELHMVIVGQRSRICHGNIGSRSVDESIG